MIFAAGLGTRLLPLTSRKPKALIEVNGTPLLQILIEKLIRSGITGIIINVHHYPDQIAEFLKNRKYFGIRIELSDESDLLLDTGGGLKKAAWFFDDGNPFLVHNVDVLTDLNLKELLRYHQSSRALATLAVRSRKSSRYLMFDGEMQLGGWKNIKTGERIIVAKKNQLKNYAFSGIHIIEPELLGMMNETGTFSVIETYLRLAVSNIIKGYLHDHSEWIDVGKPMDLEQAMKNYEPDSVL